MKNGLNIDKYGCKRWYLNGSLHREDGPAIEDTDGVLEWYLNGKLHKENGPAHISKYGKEWCINDLNHRLDGPAIEWEGGAKAWYFNGEYIDCQTQEEFEQLIKLKAFW